MRKHDEKTFYVGISQLCFSKKSVDSRKYLYDKDNAIIL